jgi:hypothetical protein
MLKVSPPLFSLPSFRSISLAAALVLAPFAVACGGAQDASSDTSNNATAEDDLTKALSHDLICAAVAAADNSNNGDGLTEIAKSKLKGDALKDYNAWQKGMVSDYPSAAYELPVTLKGKTYTFWMVVEMNDGGGSIGVYRTNGSTVSTESGGESDTLSWDAPADKCDG